MDSLLAGLTDRQKAAQLVMPWVSGAAIAASSAEYARVRGWVESLELGGVIVSIGTPRDIAEKVNALQRTAALPLLVAADLEGGTAFRFRGGTDFPTNMGVGAGGREADAYAMGRVIAEEGRAAGIHITFSPVADVNNNPANPIINTRSFGGDPAAVARLVAAQVRGTQEHGLVATAKHFPGHGDTETDSHLALPVVTADWARLDTLELVPFRAAIAAGVGAVMSAHIALPGVDSGLRRPATMAPHLLTGVLRDSLGFQGLIVTDALDMGGVVSGYGDGEAAVQAFLAGADILLQPRDPRRAVDALSEAVASGRVSAARLDESVRRVLTLKHRLGLFDRREVDLDRVRGAIGRRWARDAAREATTRSLVLVKDDAGVVDSLRARRRTVALVTYGEANAETVGRELAGQLERAGHRVATVRLSPRSGPADFAAAAEALRRAPWRLLAIAVRARESRGSVAMPAPLAALVEQAAALDGTLVVSLGTPYLLTQVPSIPAYLLGWTANPVVERAVAAALRDAPITGRLPVDLPPGHRIGDGLTVPARP